jgi:Nif-specific ferredoxin III
MSTITGLTRGGAVWTPSFIVGLNQTNCIGCGRCYKVCPRDVFELIDRDDLDLDDDFDDDFDEAPGMVMNLKDALDCIGCEACSRVCPKSCLSHEPQAMAA